MKNTAIKVQENHIYKVADFEIDVELDFRANTYQVTLWDASNKDLIKLDDLLCSNNCDVDIEIMKTILEAIEFAKGELSK